MTQSSIESAVIDRIPAELPQPSEAEGLSRRRAGRRLFVIGAVVVIALIGALTMGTLPRLRQEKQLDTAAAQAAAQPPRVTVAPAQRMAPSAERVLPGNSLPLMKATLYARATGFVSRRLVDIGDRVKSGQLLAEIAAPDLDDQLAQAKANLEQAQASLRLSQANLVLAKITLARAQQIQTTAPGGVSQQEVDQDQAAVDVATASVQAAQASIQVNDAAVQRCTDLQTFEKIAAPFAGIITARSFEVGDLITADNTARQLFRLMRTDTFRVFVNVPQAFATSVAIGQDAAVYRRDEPQKQYQGKVTRTANALDPNTRTLLTEVDVANPQDALRPGMYLQVKFAFDRKIFPLMIPAAALATRTKGPRVAVLDDQQRVQYREVELGRDYGAEVQVLTGLKEGEKVVVHPGDDLPEGTVVDAVPLQGGS